MLRPAHLAHVAVELGQVAHMLAVLVLRGVAVQPAGRQRAGQEGVWQGGRAGAAISGACMNHAWRVQPCCMPRHGLRPPT